MFLILLPTLLLAQAKTGINTTDPQVTLDINGNLIVRTPEVLSATNTTGGGMQGATITGASIQSSYNTPGFSLSLLKL